MNIIYLDTLFLVNFICDYVLLLCSARVSGAVIRRLPFLFSAAIGGIYACMCTHPHFAWLSHPLIKAACCVLLCIISFGNEQKLLRCTVVFLCVSAMTGGMLSAIAIPYGSLQYIPIHTKTLLLSFAAVYFLLTIFFRRFPQLCHRQYHKVCVTMNNRTVSFSALRDSGNELFDPISNRPVLVCQAKTLQPLFTIPLHITDPYELFCQLNTSAGCENRMRLIPCQTVTGTGMLLAFRADRIAISGKESPHMIAFATADFSPDAPYQAIF